MTIHTSLLFKFCSRVAQGQPLVVAGDFNFMPGSPCYNLVTTGDMDEADPCYPPADPTGKWSPKLLAPFRSAYLEGSAGSKAEPNFTNYAQVRDEPEFIETLDYIFLSGSADGASAEGGDEGGAAAEGARTGAHWRVSEVLELPDRSEVEGPLPNADEPSDHIMIASTLELVPGAAAEGAVEASDSEAEAKGELPV